MSRHLNAKARRELERLEEAEERIQTPHLQRYWTDPAYRAELDAETDAMRAAGHARLDAHHRLALIALGYVDA